MTRSALRGCLVGAWLVVPVAAAAQMGGDYPERCRIDPTISTAVDSLVRGGLDDVRAGFEVRGLNMLRRAADTGPIAESQWETIFGALTPMRLADSSVAFAARSQSRFAECVVSHVATSRALATARRHAEAVVVARAATTSFSSSSIAWAALGRAIAETGDYRRSEEAFLAALQIDSNVLQVRPGYRMWYARAQRGNER